MALVLIPTVGGATSNTYATLVEAEAYMLTVPMIPDWTASTDPIKNAALVQAARMMDTLTWKGLPTTLATQALQWPRAWCTNRDGYAVASDVIPQKIKDAQCEFALRLIADDRAADAGGLVAETVDVGSLKIGKLRQFPIPASVLSMVREFMAGSGQTPTVRA
jgi:hypothetical protein